VIHPSYRAWYVVPVQGDIFEFGWPNPANRAQELQKPATEFGVVIEEFRRFMTAPAPASGVIIADPGHYVLGTNLYRDDRGHSEKHFEEYLAIALGQETLHPANRACLHELLQRPELLTMPQR